MTPNLWLLTLLVWVFGCCLLVAFTRSAKQLSFCETDGDLIPDQHTEDPDHGYFGSDDEPAWSAPGYEVIHLTNVTRIIPLRRPA